MMIVKIFLYSLLWFCFCSSNSVNKTCDSFITSFDYPQDLNNLPKKNHICSKNLLSKARKYKITLVVKFDDTNFTLASYEEHAVILYDKQYKLYFFIRRHVDSEDFNRQSIANIYLLDENLMPLYVLFAEMKILDFSGPIVIGNQSKIEKIVYEDKSEKLYSLNVNLKSSKVLDFTSMDYKTL